MTINPDEKEILRLSKSRLNMFKSCPLSYRLCCVDKVSVISENPYFIAGTEVHRIIEELFKTAKISIDGDIILDYNIELNNENLDLLEDYGINLLSYITNVLKFENNRYKILKSNNYGKEYFFPALNETKFVIEEYNISGIVDRVHKCAKCDPLSAFKEYPDEFKDGDLVIVENKTGKSSILKAAQYCNDLIWYKFLIDESKLNLGEIKWGTIYFPYDNTIYHFKILDNYVKELKIKILEARKKIKDYLESKDWPANPSLETCNWCQYNKICLFSKYNRDTH